MNQAIKLCDMLDEWIYNMDLTGVPGHHITQLTAALRVAVEALEVEAAEHAGYGVAESALDKINALCASGDK